jgi:hypothetical protein
VVDAVVDGIVEIGVAIWGECCRGGILFYEFQRHFRIIFSGKRESSPGIERFFSTFSHKQTNQQHLTPLVHSEHAPHLSNHTVHPELPSIPRGRT